MNTNEIKALRDRINAAHVLDTAGEWNPMSTGTPALDAAIAEMGAGQYSILLACEDAIEAATDSLRAPLPRLRARICEICTGREFWKIHHMAEAIYSAAGLSDAQAFQAGRLGIHTETEAYDAGEFGTQYVVRAV